MMHTYRNPWAKPYEPQDYTRNCPAPVNYSGCQLFHVLPDQWDVVKSGVCIAQRAGRKGAEHAAELVVDLMFPAYKDVWERRAAEIEAGR